MDTLQSVLLSVQKGDWMVSVDLKDAYSQVPIHPDSHKYQVLSPWSNVPIQGSVLWSLHSSSSFHEGHGSGFDLSALCGRSHLALPGRLVDPGGFSFSGASSAGCGSVFVPQFGNCWQLGEVSSGSFVTNDLSWYSSGLGGFQGFTCPEESREASLNRRRILVLHRAASLILARALRSFVFPDSSGSGRSSQDALPPTSSPLLGSTGRFGFGVLESGVQARSGVVAGLVSYEGRRVSGSGVPEPRLFGLTRWDVEWGAHLGDNIASGLWSPQDSDLSINARELLAVERGLHPFAPLIVDSAVAVFADSSTAVAYLHKKGGTHSPLLNSIAQRILWWAESLPLALASQFIMGRNNVLADALSSPNQIQGSE